MDGRLSERSASFGGVNQYPRYTPHSGGMR